VRTSCGGYVIEWTMGRFDEGLKWCRERRTAALANLAVLASGEVRQWDIDRSSGTALDTTDQWIESLKGDIARLENLIATYEPRNT